MYDLVFIRISIIIIYLLSVSSLICLNIEIQRTKTSVALKIISQLFTEQENFKGIQMGSQIMESNENNNVDCQVSEWSKWSRCENCHGDSIRTREIMVQLYVYSSLFV